MQASKIFIMRGEAKIKIFFNTFLSIMSLPGADQMIPFTVSLALAEHISGLVQRGLRKVCL